MFRALAGAVAPIGLAALSAGCFNPSLNSIRCDESRLCPPGTSCFDGQCVRPGAVPDAAVAPDGPTGLQCSDWQPAPAHLAPCDLEYGAPLVITGAGVLDTDAQTLVVNGVAVDVPTSLLAITPLVDATVLAVGDFRIAASGSVRAIGSRPLYIAALGSIQIDGLLDVSSSVSNGLTDAGAGSHPPLCADNAAGDGVTDDIGGGGGGGGFGSAGGAGGRGVSDGAVASGGPGGALVDDQTLRGGCNGGDGGASLDSPQPAPGGAAGGAVHLAAAVNIVVTGTVTASGGGGRGNLSSLLGGGGGGSGGLIGLDAQSVTISATGLVLANGGGGGAAQTVGSGNDGTTAANVAPAPGGDGTEPGGNGAAASDAAEPGSSANIFAGDSGGGGGGGGLGKIVIHGSLQNEGQASPVPESPAP